MDLISCGTLHNQTCISVQIFESAYPSSPATLIFRDALLAAWVSQQAEAQQRERGTRSATAAGTAEVDGPSVACIEAAARVSREPELT